MAANRNGFAARIVAKAFACWAIALLGWSGAGFAQQVYGPTQGEPSPELAMKTLHDALHLSVQQEPAWGLYRAQIALSTQARARQQAAALMMPSLDAPHRMDLIEAELRQELADLHSRAQALKGLYDQLTPSQRRTFDQSTLPPRDTP